MALNVSRKLIESHLVEGEMRPGEEIAIEIDQTLTQDATGTLVMLELEAMGLDRVKTELSAQYVDHNLIQEDFKNPDDHLFLRSACQRFGVWYGRPGTGVSHPVHMERFGKPGKSLIGSDSHTPAAGSLGMLAIGAGGLEVAMAMAGRPCHLNMPQIWGVRLTGRLPDWVSAKDVILEMLRRHDVDGAAGCIIEYYGPGLEALSAMDRHVIANMGTELGATTTVFPADGQVRSFLRSQGREDDYRELVADPEASYDRHEEIDLSQLEPLTAKPSSPGNVVPVSQVAGRPVYQCYIGSSANPGYRDFAVAAEIVKGRRTSEEVSFDINPTSRQILENLVRDSHILSLIQAGARLHQAGCNGCIGMGQAPATGQISLRTVPRNFPARSGTVEDAVYLVSPETAAASALTGKITDPRTLDMDYPRIIEPDHPILHTDALEAPLPESEAAAVELRKGPNIASIPDLQPVPEEIRLPVLLKVADDVSTDEIMPAGSEVLPFRSNIPKISEFVYRDLAPDYARKARQRRDDSGHAVVGGDNYGQGSSREHAALAPRYLGLRLVLAKSFARIHWQNLVNFGILPLSLASEEAYDSIGQGDQLRLSRLHSQLRESRRVEVENLTQGDRMQTRHALSPRQVEVLLAGGLIPWMRAHK
ncbi:MAG TPA: aconitate hydratase [Acidobacteriota bacterium]|nr:aconitate hydratase [Acidobacteriota bacterium]